MPGFSSRLSCGRGQMDNPSRDDGRDGCAPCTKRSTAPIHDALSRRFCRRRPVFDRVALPRQKSGSSKNSVHRRRIDNELSHLRRCNSTRTVTTHLHLSGRASSPVLQIFSRSGEEAKIARRSLACGRKQLCKPGCEIVYSRRPVNQILGSASSPSGAARWRRKHLPRSLPRVLSIGLPGRQAARPAPAGTCSFISGLINRATTRRRRHDRCPSLVNTLFADEPGTSAMCPYQWSSEARS